MFTTAKTIRFARWTCLISFTSSLLLTPLGSANAWAEGPAATGSPRLVASMLQDQPIRMPLDNTVSFSSGGGGISIDALVAADTQAEADLLVAVVTPNGEEQELVADRSGRFQIPNPIEGLYAVVARSATAIATIPFYARQVGGADNAEELSDPLEPADEAPPSVVSVPLIADGRSTVDQLAEQYVSYEEPSPVDPIRFDFNPSVRHGYQVYQDADGNANGRVIIASDQLATRDLLANNNLFLIKNGVRLQNTLSDDLGRFRFADVDPGLYGLVAAGPAGYTAFGFEVLAAEALTDNRLREMRQAGYVAAEAAIAVDELPCVMIPPELVPAVLRLQRRDTLVAPPAPFPADGFGTPLAGGGGFGPGGLSGGGGFAGGGGFGGGGLGGLAGLAGLAAAVAAISADDDNNVNRFEPIPVPISRAAP